MLSARCTQDSVLKTGCYRLNTHFLSSRQQFTYKSHGKFVKSSGETLQIGWPVTGLEAIIEVPKKINRIKIGVRKEVQMDSEKCLLVAL